MDDTISRQAAIDYFVTNVGFHDEDGYPIEDECELREIWTGYFDGIPSAEPKRGKWTLKSYRWECDQCGCLIRRENPFKGNEWNYNYCPNCGAKMEVTE